MIEFKDWIDLNNIEHVKAVLHLKRYGVWPENFIPDNVHMEVMWYVSLLELIAKNWINEKQVDILFMED